MKDLSLAVSSLSTVVFRAGEAEDVKDLSNVSREDPLEEEEQIKGKSRRDVIEGRDLGEGSCIRQHGSEGM